ncbi:MAG: GNAT family N-acetyltransferase [Terriglobales bacterium]
MIDLEDVILRPLEPKDVESLYSFRNDWEVIQHLAGFSAGYSRQAMADWVQRHSNRHDEVLWAIEATDTNTCIGHVGLYQIDHRVGKAEFAIVLGDRNRWGKGLGRKISEAVVDWGFKQLNLHKVTLAVLTNNERAIHIYETLGFRREGVLRDEQFRDGRYLDLMLMSVLRQEWCARHAGGA